MASGFKRSGRLGPIGVFVVARIVAALALKVEGEGGSEGIVVTRQGDEQSDWLCDPWLAEHIAAS